MADLSVAEVLDRAADLIEPEGAWTQGTYGRDVFGSEVEEISQAACFCAMGAIYAAAGFDIFEHDADLIKPLGDLLDRDDMGIDDFNDAPERTQAEVVAKLREAAALAREQGQ